jgi:hypothetical protein
MPMNPRLLRPLAAGGFNPSRIAGLQLWLDAADSSTITTDTGVSEWRDKSATKSKWAQTTGNEQPATGTQTMNGKNVLAFDGSNDSLSASAPLNTSMPLSFFIVQRIVAKSAFGMSYTTGGANDNFNIRQIGDGTGKMTVTAGGGIFLGDGATGDRQGQNDIFVLSFPSGAGTAGAAYLNGSQLSQGAGADNTRKPILTGTHYIGRRSDGFYSNFRVAEIIAYSTLLTDTQRKSVESYLGKKWGITVT